jgi:hypothetical protein
LELHIYMANRARRLHCSYLPENTNPMCNNFRVLFLNFKVIWENY